MIGISIKPYIGVGDALQFSSLPENYFRAKGEKLFDVSRPWFFDYNPYVCRDDKETPTLVRELWNFGPHQKYEWPKLRTRPTNVYLSNAEIWAMVLNVPTIKLNRPRLYRYEDFPYQNREMILLHTHGRSHGTMPDHVIEHVLRKYGPTRKLYHIGVDCPDLGITRIKTNTLWDLANVISRAKMVIGMDSGPAWVASCYPDVVVKKLRAKPSVDVLKDWVPLEMANIHAHWDDRSQQIFNVSEYDVGFTSSYRKI